MEIKNLVNQLEKHSSREWRTRSLSRVNKIIIHQELGEGTIENVNRYHISPNHISAKGCPKMCYHYGIRKNGEIVQVNKLTDIVWHTKGQNTSGIGIMLVGNFAGPGHNTGTSEPTKEQIDSLDFLTKYLFQAFNLSNQELFGHYHFGKPACPGTIVQNWIENKRNDISIEMPEAQNIEKTVTEIQKRLNKLGYASGKADGIQGVKTLAAIRRFQSDNQMIIDGIVGPNTWKKLILLTA